MCHWEDWKENDKECQTTFCIHFSVRYLTSIELWGCLLSKTSTSTMPLECTHNTQLHLSSSIYIYQKISQRDNLNETTMQPFKGLKCLLINIFSQWTFYASSSMFWDSLNAAFDKSIRSQCCINLTMSFCELCSYCCVFVVLIQLVFGVFTWMYRNVLGPRLAAPLNFKKYGEWAREWNLKFSENFKGFIRFSFSYYWCNKWNWSRICSSCKWIMIIQNWQI